MGQHRLRPAVNERAMRSFLREMALGTPASLGPQPHDNINFRDLIALWGRHLPVARRRAVYLRRGPYLQSKNGYDRSYWYQILSSCFQS